MSDISITNGCYDPDESGICRNPQKNWSECFYLDKCSHYKQESEEDEE